MFDFLVAALLGLIEGLTEFIPVSSTAHLLVLTDLFKFAGPPGHVFEIFIQLGAILAVVVLYWSRLWKTAITLHSDPALCASTYYRHHSGAFRRGAVA